MSCTETKNESSHTVCGLEREREQEQERELERHMTHLGLHPEGTPVERQAGVIERMYLREDGTNLCMGKEPEADERSLVELWDAIFGRETNLEVRDAA
jgi:hypothetical protein